MRAKLDPRSYEDWRTDPFKRAEDAAYTFGYHLIQHCRDEAMGTLPAGASSDTRKAVEEAVDTALHNVCDMLEGYWKLEAGPNHAVQLVLGIQVQGPDGKELETQNISPCKLDLPIGYWKWARDREFK